MSDGEKAYGHDYSMFSAVFTAQFRRRCMKKWILPCVLVAVPLLFLLAGCVYPGTGTLSF